MSDRIAVMFEGAIGQMADPETLYRRPNSRKVADFIGKMNFLRGTVEDVGEKVTVDVEGFGRVAVAAEQAPGGALRGETTIGIRPEMLGILFPGETTDRRLIEGVVDEVVYYGDMTYYDVRVPGIAHPLDISMKNMVGRPVLEVGTPTKVIWDERSIVVLSR
jgi:spermidine/putrescine transport system ATP-binding protein